MNTKSFIFSFMFMIFIISSTSIKILPNSNDDSNLIELEVKIENELNFKFQSQSEGCLSIGFFNDSISNEFTEIDIYSVCFEGKNQFSIFDQFFKKGNGLFNDEEIGGKFSLEGIKHNYQNNFYSVSFSRKFNSEDKFDLQYQKDKKINFIAFSGALDLDNIERLNQKKTLVINNENQIIFEEITKNYLINQTLNLGENEVTQKLNFNKISEDIVLRNGDNALEIEVKFNNPGDTVLAFSNNKTDFITEKLNMISMVYVNETKYSLTLNDHYGNRVNGVENDESDYYIKDINVSNNTLKFELHFRDKNKKKESLFFCYGKNEYSSDKINLKNLCPEEKFSETSLNIGKDQTKIFLIIFTAEFKYNWHYVHGYFQMISWTLFTFVGIMTATYFKFYKNWIWVHRFCNGVTALGNVSIGIFGLLIQYKRSQLPHDLPHVSHMVCGVTILSLCAFQLVFGILNRWMSTSSYMTFSLTQKIKCIHKIVGLTTVCITCINLTFGPYLLFHTHFVVLIQAFFILLYIALRIVFIYYERQKATKLREIPIRDLPEFTDEDLKKLDKKFVFYDNYLVDVGHFLDSHPGGKNPLVENLGLDVSRFLNQCVPFNSKYKNHSHSFLTMKHIMTKLTFGIYNHNSKLCVDENEKNVTFDLNCKIANIRKIAKDTFEYQIVLNNSDYKFSRMLPGTKWIGKHYSLTSLNLNKTRYYSICFCLNSEIHSEHLKLLKNIEILENKNEPFEIKDKSGVRTDKIEIYVKKYDFKNTLSAYINDNKDASDLYIKGPIGLGLDLDHILKGTYVAFGGGTGVFCFIDFIAYILRYQADKIASKHFNYHSNKLIHSETFDNIQSDFKIIYFSTFRDQESEVYNDMCDKMKELDEKYNMNIFKFIKKISSVNRQEWNTKYLSEVLDPYKSSIEKVFICGPPAFLDSIKENLLLGSIVDKSKIRLV